MNDYSKFQIWNIVLIVMTILGTVSFSYDVLIESVGLSTIFLGVSLMIAFFSILYLNDMVVKR